jgi:hypothetical protein
MRDDHNLNESHRVVVPRRSLGEKPRVVARKPFVWEIRHTHTEYVLRSCAEPFSTMDEAHRAGVAAFADMHPDRTSQRRLTGERPKWIETRTPCILSSPRC